MSPPRNRCCMTLGVLLALGALLHVHISFGKSGSSPFIAQRFELFFAGNTLHICVAMGEPFISPSAHSTPVKMITLRHAKLYALHKPG